MCWNWTVGCLLGALAGQSAAQERMLIGTSDGAIRIAKLSVEGALTVQKFAGTGPLMFLAVHPSLPMIYAATPRGVKAFHFDGKELRSGANRELGMRVTHVEVDRQGRFLYAASYGGNTVLAMPLDAKGAPGAPTLTLAPPGFATKKAHQVRMHPTLDFVYAPCLGDDTVQVLAVQEGIGGPSKGTKGGRWAVRRVGQAKLASGSGPRHLDFHPDGEALYVLNELSSSIYAYGIDPKTGQLEEFQRLRAVPDSHQGGSGSSDIHVSADGRFAYAVHREPRNEIVTLAIGGDRKLTVLDRRPTGGRHSRSFALSPDGRFLVLAHSRSKDVVVHRRDPTTGKLQRILSKFAMGAAAVFVGFIRDPASRSYGRYELRSLWKLIQEPGFDMTEVDRVLRDLEAHALVSPPEFRTSEERQRAQRDARALVGLLSVLTKTRGPDSEGIENGTPPPGVWRRLARAATMGHNLGVDGAAPKALRAFEEALKKNPQDGALNLRFANFLLSASVGVARALPVAETAKKLGQRGADLSLGRAHLILGNKEKAIAHLEMHCKAQPGDREARALLDGVRSGEVRVDKTKD